MTTLYPDQLNPFGEEEEENNDNNPFKSDDDDEAVETIKRSSKIDLPSQKIIPEIVVPTPITSSNNAQPTPHPEISPSPRYSLRKDVISNVVDVPREIIPPKPKPSPLPRRSLALQDQAKKEDRPQSAGDVNLSISPLPPRSDGSLGDLTGHVKRRAPSIPLGSDGSASSLRTLPSPEKSPLTGVKKKLAPPPPTTHGQDGNDQQRRKSSTDVDVRNMEDRLNELKVSNSQSSSIPRRDSNASASSGARISLTPDSESLNQHSTSSMEDMEEQQYLELMRSLQAEHQAIESELRDLMAIPTKLRSPAQIAREQRLINDLMDNVKKREELEDEEEELQTTLGDAGNPVGQPKKMKKKKRKFKIRNLLGVK